ncbi:MAG TPA: ABC transporter substrate-binding protein [Candidatus Dormibacteraeota bacterium]|nr:ABC transporter substrate-binding protein [Candidatus Dormibacteraeota bacterium]
MPPVIANCQPGTPGGRFTLAIPFGPRTFNPLIAADASSDQIVRLLGGSLINLNWQTQEPGPGLAEQWGVGPDNKTWTFKLRQGARWSDGKLIKADDVVFTWNDVMYDPQLNHFTFDLFRIDGKKFEVSKVDDYTVRVVTPEVFAPFLEYFGGVTILPKHVLESAVRQKRFPGAYNLGTSPDNIVGCGPYKVKEVRQDKSVLLERNPEYWVADKQGRRLPYFDEVLFSIGGAPGSDVALFLNGKSDAYDVVRGDMLPQFQQSSTNAHFQVLDLGVGTERDFLWFNENTGTNQSGKPIVDPVKLKWFRNKNFRQAISCAIDRERMVKEIYQDKAQAIYGFISSENQKWYNANIPKYGYDLDKARALLSQAGIQERTGNGVAEDAEGHPVEFTLHSNTGNAARERCATLIQEDLKKLGIKLTYIPTDFNLLRERIDMSYDYEAALMGLGGGGIDPASQVNVLKSGEDLHQWFPAQKSPSTDWEARIDKLMDAQMRTLDFAERKKAFDEVQTLLAEELPMIYTIAPFAHAAVRQGIANLRPSVLTPYRVTWNVEELCFSSKPH